MKSPSPNIKFLYKTGFNLCYFGLKPMSILGKFISRCHPTLVHGDQNESKLLTEKINCLFYKVSLLTDLKSLQIKQGKNVMCYHIKTNIYSHLNIQVWKNFPMPPFENKASLSFVCSCPDFPERCWTLHNLTDNIFEAEHSRAKAESKMLKQRFFPTKLSFFLLLEVSSWHWSKPRFLPLDSKLQERTTVHSCMFPVKSSKHLLHKELNTGVGIFLLLAYRV